MPLICTCATLYRDNSPVDCIDATTVLLWDAREGNAVGLYERLMHLYFKKRHFNSPVLLIPRSDVNVHRIRVISHSSRISNSLCEMPSSFHQLITALLEGSVFI